jgi:hypothetical protein
MPLADWSEFARCRPEPATGFHEVYFRYDDEPEYWARARNLADQVAFYQYTTVSDIPVIVSLLFDGDGFLMGHRIVSDPRVGEAMRENGSSLAGILRARYGEDNFACEDRPPLPGESAFQGIFINRECRGVDSAAGIAMYVLERQLRKLGQRDQDVLAGPTAGLFESTTFFEALSVEPIPDRPARLAGLPERGESERDRLVARARNCPACDLRGADLKRAELSGANLAGADLTGANLIDANLSGADLTDAYLTDARLNGAKLTDANLRGASLHGADLTGADLTGATLTGATLTDANLARVRHDQWTAWPDGFKPPPSV